MFRDAGEARASIFYGLSQRPLFRDEEWFCGDDLALGWSQRCHLRLRSALRYTRPLLSFLQ